MAHHRPHPIIPDHEVLRKIGGGAYGEVWMARGVTGALRAVKVVWREDFDDERSFEREFEGILKFEPISRHHPGLVHILHVGRSPDFSFYYYVMELGDDVATGAEINPIEYEPRTLRPDSRIPATAPAASRRLEVGTCIEVGLRLAEALDYLHQQGLAHRDVKPSNVIFVQGKAKLADIGLVAARGQRTFVGTEGFVPPEGPGSAQADVYALGKVLYEIATGNDRLDFPELPSEIPGGVERKRWLELNKIICEVCEPRLNKRRITQAAELALALRRLMHGKRRHHAGASIWFTSFLLLSFATWATWQALKDHPWFATKSGEGVAQLASVRVITTPEGAEVYDASGMIVGMTPTAAIPVKVGQNVRFVVRRKGYRPIELEAVVSPDAAREPMILFGQLPHFSPPVAGELWEDHLGNSYQPIDTGHFSSLPVTWQSFATYVAAAQPTLKAEVERLTISHHGEAAEIVLACQEDFAHYASWLMQSSTEQGFLTSDHEVIAQPITHFQHPELSARAREQGLRPAHMLVREIVYGAIQLSTNPPGAEVYHQGKLVGTTAPTLLIARVRPGEVKLLVVLEGYRRHYEQVVVSPAQNSAVHIDLQPNHGVVFGREWSNGLGMRFVPLNSDVMVSAYETRVRDYALFVREGNYQQPRQPVFPQSPDDPVVYVSREDAKAFASWLTERERSEERIAMNHLYRLPTDLEWSRMIGLGDEPGSDPNQRDATKPRRFAWGTSWPPPQGIANFADESAAELPGLAIERTIPGYRDGFARTAPVGSFAANELGIYDLSGNVQEWVADAFSRSANGSLLGVARGGGWSSYLRENLHSGWRNPLPPSVHEAHIGFRLVLAKTELPLEP